VYERSDKARTMPPRLKARHIWQAALVALVGVGLTVLVFHGTWRDQNERARHTLTAVADWRATDLSNKLSDTADFGAGMAALFSIGLELDQETFARFATTRAEDETVTPRGIAWAPRVLEKEREAFQDRARFDIRPDYRIVDRPVPDAPPADPRPLYFPILFATVFSGTQAQPGFDLLRSPHGGPAIRKAIDTGQPIATRPQTQEGIAAAGPAFVAYRPVFPAGIALTTPEDRRARVLGIIAASFQLEPALNDAIADTPKLAEDLYVMADAPHSGAPGMPLAVYRSNAPRFWPASAPVDPHDLDGLVLERAMSIKGQDWRLIFHFGPEQMAALRTNEPFWRAGLCLLLTAMTIVYVLQLQRREVGALEASASARATAAAAERERRGSEAKLATLVEASPVAMMSLDRGGLVATWNGAAKTLTGHEAGDTIGRPLPFGDPHDGSDLEHIVAQALAGHSALGVELSGRHRDGSRLRLLLSAAPVRGEDGAVTGVMVVALDISPLRTIEQQLRQAQKMEAIGQLTGGLAHDLNNILGVVIGNLDLVHLKLKDRPAESELLENAMAAALRGGELNRALLAFARRQSLQPEAIDARGLLGGMFTLIERTLGSNISVEMKPAARLWPVKADPAQLEAAVLNLCVNARDAMPDGGVLTIEARNKSLDGAYTELNPEVFPGDYVEIAVSDTGTGMAPEVLACVFEPFFTTKDVGKGSGLGLSMVYGFLKQSGGHAKIYSEQGHGTSVHLYLPRHRDGAAGDAAPAAPPPSQPGHETILVVEDNPDLRRVAIAQLHSFGYTVHEATNAAEALAIIDRHPVIDLLFTDVMMPGGDGRSLAREALKRRPGLKVLLTTGFATEATAVIPGNSDHGFALINKPYRAVELAAELRRLLGEEGVSA
jgi:PAS domain S-box-containing protein